MMMVPRGLRNNNPGNIRKPKNAGGNWMGLARMQSDPAFLQFATMTYGCRALIKTLQTYTHKHGLSTVEQIINRWAPPVENNTSAYVKHVAKALGVAPDEAIDVKDPQTYITLAKAIARHENGDSALDIEDTTWIRAAKLAGLVV